MANVALRNVRKTYAGGFEAIKGIETVKALFDKAAARLP